ncbi:septum formation protein Maf [Pedobacter sp. SD-b]|uniref:dTTP/UTP pyrophosphatase n=1 Tax=Pedobacter segetis TaxID=2793069 RepID=A0ABS1BJA3_9SPHI|nr:Maf family nucleotide pyrophosphatase [Pedobacter segetis]MBK0382945.1 septum formation protein Maf [Pedobacter segetis]
MKIYLASKSPRRQELLKLMGFEFELMIKEIDESYPAGLPLIEVAPYLSKIKSDAFEINYDDEIIITADTVVIINDELLGKPKNNEHAFEMLSKLNGRTHLVVTGVTIKSKKKVHTFSQTTKVAFSKLSDDQLWFYILNYRPLDKAGAYGIQDWIGMVGVSSIEGSYTNVMGLPTEKLNSELMRFL